MNKEIVYIAGPINAPTPEGKQENLQKGEDAAREIAEKGIWFFSPHCHSRNFGHLQPNTFWYELDLKFMDVCSVALFLEGWENSVGCKIEHNFAIQKDMKIFYDLQDLFDYFTVKNL